MPPPNRTLGHAYNIHALQDGSLVAVSKRVLPVLYYTKLLLLLLLLLLQLLLLLPLLLPLPLLGFMPPHPNLITLAKPNPSQAKPAASTSLPHVTCDLSMWRLCTNTGV